MRGFGTQRETSSAEPPHPIPLPAGEREEHAARELPNVLARESEKARPRA
jgi:hypothetical protein